MDDKNMIIRINMETGEVEKSIETIEDGLDNISDKSKDIGKDSKKGFGAMSDGLKAGKRGFTVLKGAIAATGIGALITGVIALKDAFMANDKVARVVEKTMAAIGAAVGVVVDAFVVVGEAIVTAFTTPQTAIDYVTNAINTVWSVITGVTKLIKESFILTLQTMKAGLIQASIAALEFFSAGFADTSGLEKELQKTKDAINDTKKEITKAAGQVAGPFVSAFKSAKKFVGDLTKEMVTQSRRALKLAESQRKLRDNIRNVALDTAKARSEIALMKKDSDDINLSLAERIQAAKDAAAAEEELRAKRQKTIEQGIQLMKKEIEIHGSNEDRLQALNDLRIENYAIEEEGAALQTEMMTKIASLKKEQFDAEQGYFSSIKEFRERNLDDQEKEIIEMRAHFAELLVIAEDYNLDTTELLEQRKQAEAEINEKYRQLEEDKDKEAEQTKLEGIRQVRDAMLQSLLELNASFSQKTIEQQEREDQLLGAIERETNVRKKNALIKQLNDEQAIQTDKQKKAFDRGKKLQIAQTLISTYESATQSYNSLAGIPVVGPALGFAAAAAAVAAGLANVNNIRNQKFDAPAPMAFVEPETADVSSAGNATAGGGGGSPMLDLSFLGAGDTQNVQAFVISNEVTTSQQTDQLIQDQASIVN